MLQVFEDLAEEITVTSMITAFRLRNYNPLSVTHFFLLTFTSNLFKKIDSKTFFLNLCLFNVIQSKDLPRDLFLVLQ